MRTRRNDSFTTITTEGSILPADLLQRVAALDNKGLGGLTPDAYHLAGGERLNEATNRSWNRLVGAWESFRSAREALPVTDAGTTLTREKWLLPLFSELGYGRLLTTRAIEIDGKSYPVSHAWQNTPIHLVSFRVELDKRMPGIAGASHASPHGMVQELLNRSKAHLWAFVANGLRLRVLRDNMSLTRQAYLEFDLEAMMEGEAYADFAVLWLVCHESRVEAERPEESWLERWSKAVQEQGTRAREELRKGVEAAITALGAGFLRHPMNEKLCQSLESGALGKQDYYRQLLRQVYRLLFLFVAEDRGLLLQPDAHEEARDRYIRFYSTARLRRLAERRRGTRHGDLWRGFRIVVEKLGGDDGCPGLALPALGSFLFSSEATPDLDACEIENTDTLDAVRALAFTAERNVQRAVDYRNLQSEELGSIYESLLELHPRLDVGAGVFSLETAAGHERKATGSYYTPDSLVQCLLDSALDPVLDEAAKKDDPEAAILELKVCDPAVGSGHFLVAAAHRMARRLAAIRTGEAEAAPDAVRHALRDVIARCLFGVDVNPMAVELCKFSLWLEAMDPRFPLSFLDHHLQHGHSLLGATPRLVADGIPDDAFKPIEGDDPEIARALRTQNLKERTARMRDAARGLVTLAERAELASQARSIETLSEESVVAVRAKAARWVAFADELQESKLLADAWCSAFMVPKVDGEPVVTDGILRTIELGETPSRTIVETIKRLADEYGFFHWHIAFPQVFSVASDVDSTQLGWVGGFDCVLGNPPWDMQEAKDNEFFAESFPEILSVKSAKDKTTVFDLIKTSAPALWDAYQKYIQVSQAQRRMMADCGRFPLSRVGRMNLYRLFLETGHTIVVPEGRLGMVVPSGFVSDSFSQHHFATLHGTGRLISFYDFENRRGLFPGVHSSFRFGLLTIGAVGACYETDFVFFAHNAGDLTDSNRHIRLSQNAVSEINPITKTAPLFRAEQDYALTCRLYKAGRTIVSNSTPDNWSIRPTLMFMMNAQMKGHRTAEELEKVGYSQIGNRYTRDGEVWYPFYEGKMVGMYDHRAASIRFNASNRVRRNQPVSFSDSDHKDPSNLAQPLFWLNSDDVEKRCGRAPRWLLAVKDITSSTNERTCIAAMLPAAALTDSLPWLDCHQSARLNACLLANLNSFAFDYVARLCCITPKTGEARAEVDVCQTAA